MSENKEMNEENMEKVALDDPTAVDLSKMTIVSFDDIKFPSTSVEVQVRYKEDSDDAREQLAALGVEVEDEEEEEFNYDYMVMNFKDISHFNRIDDGNTYVKLNDMSTWYVNIPYTKFKELYSKVLKFDIINPNEFI